MHRPLAYAAAQWPCFLLLTIFGFTVRQARADLFITRPSGSSVNVVVVSANLYDVFLLSNGGQGGIWEIQTDNADDRIRTIESQINDAGDTILKVTHNPFSQNVRVKSVQQIVQSGSGHLVPSPIEVSEDIGSISAYAIGNLDAGRDIVGPISASTTTGTQGITAALAGRNILGTLSAPNGRIGFIQAQNVGQSGSSLVRIEAKWYIQSISVSGLLHADVESGVNSGTTTGTGQMAAVSAASFDGKITTKTIVTLNPSSPQFIFSTAFTGTIAVRGSFLPQSTPERFIQTPVAGLAGQILVNTDNGGGTWSGPVKVGPDGNGGQIVLSGANGSAPYYSTTSSSLGGGAVGLVPFNLHTQDSAINSPQFLGGTCRLRFYGPIANSSPSTLPVVVEAILDGISWTDISSSYTYSISGRDLTLTATANIIDPDADTLVTIRITPRSNLTCAPSVMTGGASAPAVHTFEWQFVP